MKDGLRRAVLEKRNLSKRDCNEHKEKEKGKNSGRNDSITGRTITMYSADTGRTVADHMVEL